MSLQFEWDETKAKINLNKHGISFEEAISVFNDKLSLTVFDFEHSINEDRFIDIGLSNKNRLIVNNYLTTFFKIVDKCRYKKMDNNFS